MQVLEYLNSGKTLVDPLIQLNLELGINATVHPTDGLVILNYDQIDSPKTHPIVRECRGLVLSNLNGGYSLASRSFHRFYNWGEVADEMKNFNFNDFVTQEKLDGSLVNIFNHNKRWYANTRASFGVDNMQFQDFSWQQGFCKALEVGELGDLDSILDRNLSYACEFVSPWNKIVRSYGKPQMYLLSAFEKHRELTFTEFDNLNFKNFIKPTLYHYKSIEEIQDFLNTQTLNDPTFEGVIIRDNFNNRWKIKNPSYLSLHQMRGNGDNMFNPKYLLPFILKGDVDELYIYFEEVKEKCEEYIKIINQWKDELNQLWLDASNLESQKDFALKVKNHRLASILFRARKENKTIDELFLNSEDVLLKHLK